MKEEIKAILIQDGEPTPNNPVEIKRLLVNKEAEDYITNLQEELERYQHYSKTTGIEELMAENERLKQLCNKYEEEHSTTFNEWKETITNKYQTLKDLQEEKDKYKNVIDKIKEYCNYNNETLYTFEPDYDYEENMIENYEVSNFREDILELLEEVE